MLRCRPSVAVCLCESGVGASALPCGRRVGQVWMWDVAEVCTKLQVHTAPCSVQCNGYNLKPIFYWRCTLLPQVRRPLAMLASQRRAPPLPSSILRLYWHCALRQPASPPCRASLSITHPHRSSCHHRHRHPPRSPTYPSPTMRASLRLSRPPSPPAPPPSALHPHRRHTPHTPAPPTPPRARATPIPPSLCHPLCRS